MDVNIDEGIIIDRLIPIIEVVAMVCDNFLRPSNTALIPTRDAGMTWPTSVLQIKCYLASSARPVEGRRKVDIGLCVRNVDLRITLRMPMS